MEGEFHIWRESQREGEVWGEGEREREGKRARGGERARGRKRVERKEGEGERENEGEEQTLEKGFRALFFLLASYCGKRAEDREIRLG